MSSDLEIAKRSYRFLTLEVVDWNGPIVEILFEQPIRSAGDATAAVREASSFMRTRVHPRAARAYFITCYDGLSVTRETLADLRERFIEFNDRFSLGDVRYGGAAAARTFVVATAVHSASRSNHYESREEALAELRRQISTSRRASTVPRT